MTTRRRTIGILGGSFNPAHAGHRHISLEAMRQLKLDAVWWLVSPQNPLKSSGGMADFDTRFESAVLEAAHPRILVSNFEMQNGTRYTAETLKELVRLYPEFRFVWLMGADNLCQIHRWKDWQEIFEIVPVAVYDRRPHGLKIQQSRAAQRYRHFKQPPETLMNSTLPAWCFLRGRLHPLSATHIRNLLGDNCFMRHNINADNAQRR